MQQLGLASGDWVPASADASFRRYFRLSCGDKSWVVMDAPPEHENCEPFVRLAGQLARAGLHAPEVLAEDRDRGYLLLEDLGSLDYLNAIRGGADPEPLMRAAIEALVRWQAADVEGLPRYDADRLQAEMGLFADWFLDRHLGIRLPADEADGLRRMQARIVERALAQPQCPVHRDYMPRNLMVCEPLPGVIDFQDAVLGPYSYDVLSLFRDAFVSWPDEQVRRWQTHYHACARAAGLPVPAFEEFRADFDLIGVQRHLKVAGIFARLNYRDGKPNYLRDQRRFVDYLEAAARTDEAYAALRPVLDRVRAALSG